MRPKTRASIAPERFLGEHSTTRNSLETTNSNLTSSTNPQRRNTATRSSQISGGSTTNIGGNSTIGAGAMDGRKSALAHSASINNKTSSSNNNKNYNSSAPIGYRVGPPDASTVRPVHGHSNYTYRVGPPDTSTVRPGSSARLLVNEDTRSVQTNQRTNRGGPARPHRYSDDGMVKSRSVAGVSGKDNLGVPREGVRGRTRPASVEVCTEWSNIFPK